MVIERMKKQKPRAAVLIAMLLLPMLLTACAIPDKADNHRIPGAEKGKAAVLSMESLEFTPDGVTLHAIWKNDSENELLFGESFSLYRKEGNEWKKLPEKEVAFLAIAYSVPANSGEKGAVHHAYPLSFLCDISEKDAGCYRFVSPYYYLIDEKPTETREAFFDFIIFDDPSSEA